MTASGIAKSLLATALAVAALPMLRAQEPAKKPEMACCPMDPKASAALDKIKVLAGTWTTSAPGQPAMSVVFKPTSGGSAVIETMFPGGNEEMINLYTASGDTIMLTHYCMLGNQPRMKLSPSDDKTMKFEFVDGGNIKSRADSHMDSVALTVDGEKLTEDWAFYADGKVVDHKIFEFHKQMAK
jgi:hypothetical protein